MKESKHKIVGVYKYNPTLDALVEYGIEDERTIKEVMSQPIFVSSVDADALIQLGTLVREIELIYKTLEQLDRDSPARTHLQQALKQLAIRHKALSANFW